MEHRKRVYVATPYTHPDPEVVKKRYQTAVVVTKAIALQGASPYSPIVHGHALIKDDVLPQFDHDLWMELDEPWLQVCDVLVYVDCEGWEKSRGVKHEIDYARFLGKPVMTFAQFLERGL